VLQWRILVNFLTDWTTVSISIRMILVVFYYQVSIYMANCERHYVTCNVSWHSYGLSQTAGGSTRGLYSYLTKIRTWGWLNLSRNAQCVYLNVSTVNYIPSLDADCRSANKEISTFYAPGTWQRDHNIPSLDQT